MVGRCCSVGLPAPRGFDTHRLAHMLDSLGPRVNANLSANVESSVKLVPQARVYCWGCPGSTRRFESLPPQQFQVFSSFPHGTCSLSVSRQYLALDGISTTCLGAAFPNNPDSSTTPRDAAKTELDGVLTPL
ncbi:unnamed protein product [Bathycoccus prasinos]